MPKDPRNSVEWKTPYRFTRVPRVFIEEWLPKLSAAEVKVYLYLCHRTADYSREWDAVSLSQLEKGIIDHNGKIVDCGTGLSESTIRRALKSLKKKGLTEIRCSTGEPNLYAVRAGRGVSPVKGVPCSPMTGVPLSPMTPTIRNYRGPIQ
jgi:DNA-binding transcriptional ArsR family regulator